MCPDSASNEWTFRVNAKVAQKIGADRDAGKVAAMFGLADGLVECLYDDFEVNIAPGQIVAVVGPSGAGKTVLVNAIARQLPAAVSLDVSAISRCRQSAMRVVSGGPLAKRLKVLSRCGLAEAAALVKPARKLSGGQQYRLALAKALHSARRKGQPALVTADEFASSLDALTAMTLCAQIRKLVSASEVALLLATPRAELLDALQPDRVIVKPIAQGAHVSGTEVRSGKMKLRWRPRISRGTIADYDRLGCFHYLGGRPAAHKRVYAIRAAGMPALGGPELAAVLVVSPPVANVRGRNVATAGRYAGSDRSASLELLNREMECISRVIVHPIFRGCGLAVRLVRHAIRSAETPMVEALAAMGAVHPFFDKAGMTAYPLAADKHMSRLTSAAEAVGLASDDLPTVEPVKKLLATKRSKAARFLKAELDLAIARAFSPAQLARLKDPVAEICRRTARQYIYYLAKRK